ncbi:DNA recombination protein RmuC [Caldimonas tepidiphila]|uniref:DNA recombination protein RmuC n=1 Tax=Caldimonas tepidiphila TaxID=2315841 RepID=UPI000E5C47D0|nr:DNA recombination protein RmuC [Caldimonas tepidiphila]
MDWTFWILLALGAANLLGLLWLLSRQRQGGLAADALAQLDAALARQVQGGAERVERALRADVDRSAQGTRQELAQALNLFQQALIAQQGNAARTHNGQLDAFRAQLAAMQQAVADSLQQSTQALAAQAQSARDAQDAALRRFSEAQAAQLRELSDANERRLGEVRATVEHKLAQLAADNERKLEQMRATVDEKLHATLEQRLGESFRQVAERLEQVHRGLGEMQTLARDVGSLHRVLTNVKSRGIFGEVQLAGLLEQVFTPEQYALNVETVPGSGARVEFAIRLPGRRDDGVPLWLPIDAKFPREDYERLLEAQDRADPAAVEAAAKAIEARLRLEARTIREKYLAPPHTTEFAILFVPTEGLYAEALRRPGLVESLQREWRVTLAGPTTLLATLSSLQMGFRTFALEKRSAEVWEVLAAVKTEFGKFGEVLAKTKKKLDEASKVIDSAEVRTRAMNRKLRAVEALPEAQVQALLPAEALLDVADEEPA